MTTDNYKLRLHYETLADKLTLAPLWRRYAAELALALCGEDEIAAQKFFEGWKPETPPSRSKKAPTRQCRTLRPSSACRS